MCRASRFLYGVLGGCSKFNAFELELSSIAFSKVDISIAKILYFLKTFSRTDD
jgi:hypothetical protein